MTTRARGTGSIFFNRRQGYWQAKVILADGRRVVRSHATREEAELALDRLRDEYAGRLSYLYELPRKRAAAPIRPPISPRTRVEIFARDGYRCRYCGWGPPDVELVLDHFIPLVDGGSDDPENLLTACWECNAGKGDLVVPMPPARTISPP